VLGIREYAAELGGKVPLVLVGLSAVYADFSVPLCCLEASV
jgi:hypothetical protein